MLVRNWILELHSYKNRIEKQTKCRTRFEIQLSSIKPSTKGICEEEGKRRKKTPFPLKAAKMWRISV
jgi:hypothetical protein